MSSPSSAAVNLQRLVVLRAIILIAQIGAVTAAYQFGSLRLPLMPLFAVFGAMALVNVGTWLRLRHGRGVSDVELFAHLVFDAVALTVALYYAGGSTNPFTSLYLLPLTLTAAALPGVYTWVMLGLTGACYSLLLFYYVPLALPHTDHADDFRLHVIGMWLGFLTSAALIAYFAVHMAQTLRRHDRLRAELRERELKHQRVVALGTLAAGAAHELGTPLSTMAVLVHDLSPRAAAPDKLKILREQIERCKQILSTLSGAVGETRAESGRRLPLDAYLGELIERWRTLRPHASLRYEADGVRPAPEIMAEQTLSQAILSILNNAADVSPEVMSLHARWTDAELTLEVRDRGPGLAPDAYARVGREPFTTKAAGEGMGLGLFLAHAAIERLGGRVYLTDADGGGARCRLTLPLAPLRVAA